MNKVILGIILLLMSGVSAAQGDIWNNLFQEKLREANAGNVESQYDVGNMYLNGRGVRASRAAAVEWFGKAAAQGNAQAITRLKLMSENEARFSRTRADAERGDPGSQYELGNMYTKGIGVEVDYGKAIAAYEQSAGQGHDKAAYKLGLIHYEGGGVPVDMKAAFKWFSTAAMNNYPAAQYYLGRMYAAGQGTRKDNARALDWLSKAVDGGFDQARGAMINVTENIAMQAAAAQAAATAKAAPAPVVAKPKPARTGEKRNSEREKPATRSWSLEDLMLAAWNRDDEPVTFLPSAINNCRIEQERLVCLSDDQTRRTAANLIKFKTKAIVENFSTKGTFDVTYRNLVIDARRIEPVDATDDDTAADAGITHTLLSIFTGDDATGEKGTGGAALDTARDDSAPAVKTGWGTPHTLECTFKDRGTLTCLKNRSHELVLTSPQTLAIGK